MAEGVKSEEEEVMDVGSSISDSGSVTDEAIREKPHGFSASQIVRLKEDDQEYILLKHRFYTSVGTLAQNCTVEAIHRNMHSTPTGRARFGAFRLYQKAMMEERNGFPNVRNGWYASCKDGVERILDDGFGVCGMPKEGSALGFGLYLQPEHRAIDSVMSAAVDGDGLRHVLFCRVILGNMEEVLPGSRQCSPSSKDHDSGVDSQKAPSKYILWYSDVNTHILPLYVVSIKLDSCSKGFQRKPVRQPSSPWIPFSTLVSVLAKSLPSSTMCLIRRYHSDYMESKITREQLIFKIRQLSGDKLLILAIKSFRDKLKASHVSRTRSGKTK